MIITAVTCHIQHLYHHNNHYHHHRGDLHHNLEAGGEWLDIWEPSQWAPCVRAHSHSCTPPCNTLSLWYSKLHCETLSQLHGILQHTLKFNKFNNLTVMHSHYCEHSQNWTATDCMYCRWDSTMHSIQLPVHPWFQDFNCTAQTLHSA